MNNYILFNLIHFYFMVMAMQITQSSSLVALVCFQIIYIV